MRNSNENDKLYVDLIKARINEKKDSLEKEAIIKEAVSVLRGRGFSDEEIIQLFSTTEIIFEQTNNTMIDNNNRYLLLLKKVLGGSNK